MRERELAIGDLICGDEWLITPGWAARLDEVTWHFRNRTRVTRRGVLRSRLRFAGHVAIAVRAAGNGHVTRIAVTSRAQLDRACRDVVLAQRRAVRLRSAAPAAGG